MGDSQLGKAPGECTVQSPHFTEKKTSVRFLNLLALTLTTRTQQNKTNSISRESQTEAERLVILNQPPTSKLQELISIDHTTKLLHNVQI